jgi:bifunctional hydroxylase/dehydrase
MSTSVIIAGAGPAGLVLAGELRLAGIDVVVLERLSGPTAESRGIGLAIRTVFAQRGLLHRFGELTTSEQGHFGGVPLDLGVLDGPYRSAKTVPQSVTETVLQNWALELGAEIRRGHEVRSYREEDAHVAVRVATPDGERTLRADYLVGADGPAPRAAPNCCSPTSAASTWRPG